MALKIVRMKFCSPTHFGETGIGVEAVNIAPHSDTLFGALCHAWGILFGEAELEKTLDGYKEQPLFTLSSTFPYTEKAFLLPKPHIPPPGFQEAETREEYGKELKKQSYIPLDSFIRWAANMDLDYPKLLAIDKDLATAYQKSLRPRVALDRENSTSSLYHFGAITFREGCGLYFLVDLQDSSMEARLCASFEFLGEQGLGGERSSGYGRFEIDWSDAGSEWNALFSNTGDLYCTLSLFHPVEAEIPADVIENSAYSLIERRGWFSSPFHRDQYKRKSVTMFGEGSVFPARLGGHLVDVTPSVWNKDGRIHNVYRYGIPFWVPVVGR